MIDHLISWLLGYADWCRHRWVVTGKHVQGYPSGRRFVYVDQHCGKCGKEKHTCILSFRVEPGQEIVVQ